MSNLFLDRALEGLPELKQNQLMMALQLEQRRLVDELAADLRLVVITRRTHERLIRGECCHEARISP